MSYWTTKARPEARDYIVVRHYLRGVNYKVNGITFRDSYGVVEKDSKAYKALKQIPFFKNAKEYPLTHLKNLKFITRQLDIKQVYGAEIYSKYVLALQAEEQAAIAAEEAKRQSQISELAVIEKSKEVINVDEFLDNNAELMGDLAKLEDQEKQARASITKCTYTTEDGDLCKLEAFQPSPSLYCRYHLLEDPKLETLGIKVPGGMTKEERKKFRKKVVDKLTNLQK